MCTIDTFAIDLSSSPAMWPPLPLPPEAYDSLPGLRRMWAIRLGTESMPSFAAVSGVITSTFGTCATSVIGAKSLIGS